MRKEDQDYVKEQLPLKRKLKKTQRRKIEKTTTFLLKPFQNSCSLTRNHDNVKRLLNGKDYRPYQ
ncbi:MAG: hypothetical protein LBJ00_16040 [Planctomycetaceae bacterium]|nr:hypothetical protein [Planctomycetaceae bacterium]